MKQFKQCMNCGQPDPKYMLIISGFCFGVAFGILIGAVL